VSNLTAVSLFAGVGGFELALQNNGVDVVASVEIDDAARGVLAHQFPNATLFTDVQKVTGNDLITAGFIPEQGIITGGFPCQDLSVAGRRAGLAGSRSGLYWEIVRLAEETQAKWLVLENVPGLLSSQKGRDMGIVLGTLVDCGYSVSWRILDAQYFGVPQRRRRVFIVAGRTSTERVGQILLESQGSARNPASSKQEGQDSSDSTAGSLGKRGVLGSDSVGTLQARDFKGVGNQYVSENKLVVEQTLFGQTGFAKYTEGGTTLTATSHKRPEDNVVVCKES
jgi:DNA (cytosine-5)-methyltransferase 1